MARDMAAELDRMNQACGNLVEAVGEQVILISIITVNNITIFIITIIITCRVE